MRQRHPVVAVIARLLVASAAVMACVVAGGAPAAAVVPSDVVTFTTAGDGTPDRITLTRVGAQSCITVNEDPPTCVAGVARIVINGAADDDTLTVDFSGGDPVPPGGLFFNGGAEGPGGDTLVLQGGALSTSYAYLSPSSGVITLGSGGSIAFTGLEPIVDLVPGALTVNATNAANAVTYRQGTVAANGLVSFDNFETVEFSNKTSLTINAGDGDDTVALVNPAVPTGLTAIVVDAGNGDDRIDAFGYGIALTLAGGTGDDSFRVVPHATAAVTVDGGGHFAGDTLTVDPLGAAATDTGAAVQVSGYQDVSYGAVERVLILGESEAADLRITKMSKPDDVVRAGQEFAYTIFVDNLGPDPAYDVTIYDTIISQGLVELTGCSMSMPGPGGITTFNCGWGQHSGAWPLGDFGASLLLPFSPSNTGRVQIELTVTARTDIDFSSINNEARVTASTPDPDMDNNFVVDALRVQAVADLEVLAIAATTPSVDAGSRACWDVRVTNHGPSAAENVRVVDLLPKGLVDGSITIQPSRECWVGTPGDPADPLVCGLGTVENGASVTFQVCGDVDPAFILKQPDTGAANYLDNDAWVGSDTFDPSSANDWSSAYVFVTESANLRLQLSGVGTPVAGGLIHYEYQVSNLGPSFSEDVTLRSDLPSQVEFVSAFVDYENGHGQVPLACSMGAGSNTLFCPLGDLPPTGTMPVLALVSVRVKPDATGNITNQSDVNLHDTPDPDAANNTATTILAVQHAATVSVTKTAVAGTPASGSGATAGPPLAYAGGTITFRIAVANEGPSTAFNVAVTDTLDPSFTYLSSSSAVCTAGAPVTCSLGSLAPGDSREFDLTVRVADDLAGIASITNCAQTGWSLGDGASDTTSDCETVPTAGADLSLTAARTAEEQQVNQPGLAFQGKIPGQAFPTAPNYFASTRVTAGRRISYAFTVANAGPAAAKNVVLTGWVPAGVAYYAGSLTAPAGVNCEVLAPGDALRCAVGTLPALASAQVSFQVITDPSLEPNTTLAGGGEVTAATADPANGNNVANTLTAVMDAADLAVTILSAGSWGIGESNALEIQVRNDGPTVARDAALFISKPEELAFERAVAMHAGVAAAAPAAPGDLLCVEASPTQVICTLGEQQVTTVLGQGGGSAPLRVFAWFHVREDLPAPPIVTVTATAASFTWDPLVANNADSEDVDTDAGPPAGTADLAVALATDPPEFSPGQEVAYLVSVTNNGPAVAHDVQVTDELPSEVVLTGVDLGGGAGSCTIAGALACALGDLAAAETREFTIRGYVRRRVASQARVSNGVSVASANPDPVPENNYALATTLVRVRNLVENFSFEDLPIGPPWQEELMAPGDGQDCLVAHDGSCSYLVWGAAGVEKRLRQDLVYNGKKGDTIEVSACSKAKNASGSGAYRVELRAYLADGWRTIATKGFDGGTHGWQRRTISFTAPWNFRALAVVVKFRRMSGKAWFDEVRVKVHPGSMP